MKARALALLALTATVVMMLTAVALAAFVAPETAVPHRRERRDPAGPPARRGRARRGALAVRDVRARPWRADRRVPALRRRAVAAHPPPRQRRQPARRDRDDPERRCAHRLLRGRR